MLKGRSIAINGSRPKLPWRDTSARIHWVLEVLELCNQFATRKKGCQQRYATGTLLTYLTSDLFSK